MGIGIQELLIILLIAFLIFGAKRLPELGAGLGRAIRSFNKGIRGDEDKDKNEIHKEPNKEIPSK